MGAGRHLQGAVQVRGARWPASAGRLAERALTPFDLPHPLLPCHVAAATTAWIVRSTRTRRTWMRVRAAAACCRRCCHRCRRCTLLLVHSHPAASAADKTCPVHRRACSLRQEENYFFALSKYQAELEQLLHDSPDFVAPESRRNEVCILGIRERGGGGGVCAIACGAERRGAARRAPLPGAPARMTGAGLGARGPARLLHQPRGSVLGHPRAPRPASDRVRLVRRAQRLPERWEGEGRPACQRRARDRAGSLPGSGAAAMPAKGGPALPRPAPTRPAPTRPAARHPPPTRPAAQGRRAKRRGSGRRWLAR